MGDTAAIQLIEDVQACRLCGDLALGPKPIFQFASSARILIAGQAPGRVTHHKGIPFDDASGERLRAWLGLSREQFYDARHVAILPMAFCYPGTGKSGDLPPPKRCAEHWRAALLAQLDSVQLTLVIGQYAMGYHLADQQAKNLTETVRQWRKYWPSVLPLPHPSPRNNRWLKSNPWFESELMPVLKARVAQLVFDV